MEQQKYILKNIRSFELKDIFECGQCFRWNVEEDGSYTGVVRNNVINVKKENNSIIIQGVFKDDIKELSNNYFDLQTNYDEIKLRLSALDDNMKIGIKYGEGIRILKQDVWEALISFIISANNNIPRIKSIIEKISKKYGNKIEWNGKEYYAFPTPKQLSNASIKDLRELGLGFRDTRVFETTQMVLNNEVDLLNLENSEDIDYIRNELLKFPGVGPKVADCIMLFSMKKYEVFPIDVWVRRVMLELYENEIIYSINKEKIKREVKINNSDILNFAIQKYDKLAGLAQQYLFYWRRELEK